MVVITTKDTVMLLFWTLTCWKFVALTQTHSGISQLPYTFRCMERNNQPRTLGSATPETLKSGPNRSSMLLINNSNNNKKKEKQESTTTLECRNSEQNKVRKETLPIQNIPTEVVFFW
jgi:hypothetical protein